MNGSLPLDMAPHFPLPSDVLEISSANFSSPRLDSLRASLISLDESLSDVSNALNSLANMSKCFDENGGAQDLWKDEVFYSNNFLPVLHEVLSLPRHNLADDDITETQVMREVTRRSCLLYLALVKRKFKTEPDSVSLVKERLLQVLSGYNIDWMTSIQSLRLWVFMTIAAATDVGVDDWYVTEIVSAMQDMQIRSWVDVITVLREIAWFDELAEDKLQILRVQVFQT